jgi:hypothetical protein
MPWHSARVFCPVKYINGEFSLRKNRTNQLIDSNDIMHAGITKKYGLFLRFMTARGLVLIVKKASWAGRFISIKILLVAMQLLIT